ncbi:MAG: hypothetical protein AAF074_22560 [Pseudomonadota bacterium]
MPSVPSQKSRKRVPTAMSEPFAFAAPDAMAAAAQNMALFWSVPMRAMMVVLSAAAEDPRR